MKQPSKTKYYGTRHLIPENLESARQNLKLQLEVLKINSRGLGQDTGGNTAGSGAGRKSGTVLVN